MNISMTAQGKMLCRVCVCVCVCVYIYIYIYIYIYNTCVGTNIVTCTS